MSNFLFSASFQMLIPELPDRLTALGGADYKGYIIALFTLTAGLSRPFSGKLTDTIGRVPIMVFGSLVCVIASVFYPYVMSVFGFLFLRFSHGFSTGFKPTATSAYVADVVSADRRGEAMSAVGVSAALGMSIGPLLGSEITRWANFNLMCGVSSLLALLSVLILVNNMPETLKNKKKFKLAHLKINRDEIFDRKALPTFIVQLLLSFASGVCLTLIPDLSNHIGIANKGLFFGISTAASLAIRLIAGQASDKYGRVAVMKWASVGVIASMALLGFGQTFLIFVVAAIIFGLSWGMNTPTLAAWAVDLVDENNRGRGLATMYIALEAGIGLGAFFSAKMYDNDFAKIGTAFWVGSFFGLVSLGYLFLSKEENLVKNN
ncbi:MAG: MFS transporter [Saprospiraceae bacterium]|nr:MFS transporter [Saprospiraceae bacterium]